MNNKIYDAFYNQLLDTIDGDGYDVPRPLDSFQSKSLFLRCTFESEYRWNIDRIGIFPALKEWLQGLPGIISFPFYNGEIIELGINLGELTTDCSEIEQDKFIERYWNKLLPDHVAYIGYPQKNSAQRN